MASSNNDDNKYAKAISELLAEIKQTKIVDFAEVRTELRVLHENVKSLSRIVKDGNGEISIVTQMALLKQKLDDIYEWKEYHKDAHDKLEDSVYTLNGDIDELKYKLDTITRDINHISQKIEEQENSAKDKLKKKIELAHEQELSETKIKEARQKFWLKIIAAIVITVLTFVAGYMVKKSSTSYNYNSIFLA